MELLTKTMFDIDDLIRATRRLTIVVLFFIVCLLGTVILLVALSNESAKPIGQGSGEWKPPGMSEIDTHADAALIRYGRELIEHTSRYLGPEGKVTAISNGLNCTNCHLQAGTKAFAANFSAVASTYPKFRLRSGKVEGFEKRINDCLQRSLNGDTLERSSREMRAMVAYLKWVGKDVQQGEVPKGAGLLKLPWLSRAADTVAGKFLYSRYCSACHGMDGRGLRGPDGEWKFPPLWGQFSYNTGAGLFRLSKLAAFIKANMPFGVAYDKPLLRDSEAWDIAAFVNSRPRPHRTFGEDWPDTSSKPPDYPFGPYVDGYSEARHKFGPWDFADSESRSRLAKTEKAWK